MDPTTTAGPPPGCRVIRMPLWAAMPEDASVRLAHRTVDGEPDLRDLPKGFAARFLADELLDALVNTHAAGYDVSLDVAVIGYGADADGVIRFSSLLPDDEPKVRLIPLVELAGRPAEARIREGEPRKWTIAPDHVMRASPFSDDVLMTKDAGFAPAAAALAEVYRLVAAWLTGRYAARPPVVVHCTGGEGLDDAYARVARSLGLLVTAYGPTRLLHVVFAAGVEPTLCGLRPEGVPATWVALCELSAELPAELDGRPARRAVSVNDWSVLDTWSALFDLSPVEDSTAWAGPDAGRFSPIVRELWTQKMGNAPAEW